jgi:hypothetical protein
MSYQVLDTYEGVVTYGNGKRSCIGRDKEFQQWLRDNVDNLPDDIQAKVEAGELEIQPADEG